MWKFGYPEQVEQKSRLLEYVHRIFLILWLFFLRSVGQLIDLLSDHPIAVIKADINGKTIFRVRALGYSRDEAAAACATAAATGSKCFIAKN